jgi:hypothetical protein
MPHLCERRPGGGGAAVHSLAGDGLQLRRRRHETPALEAGARNPAAAAWLVRRYRVSPAMAAALVGPAGLGGRAP